METGLSRRSLIGGALAGIAGAAGSATVANSRSDESGMVGAARAFVGGLDEPARARAAFPFSSPERFNWHYVPRERKGLPLDAMTASQRDSALALLKASLSASGYHKVETIRQLEGVLRDAEQGRGPRRDPDNYSVSVFGDPSETTTWGWRFEGHHVSLHWTFVRGSVIASTPQFLGSNPAEVRSGPLKGTCVLKAEAELGRALVNSLTSEQRPAGILSDHAPADILTTNQRRAAIEGNLGVGYGSLDPTQQGLLISLIREHASAQRQSVARNRLARIRKAGLADVRFAWMGGLEPGQGHYYRIQGPTFLIEFDNTQDGANHIHSIWRDFKGDWGEDLLAAHYEHSPHHADGANG